MKTGMLASAACGILLTAYFIAPVPAGENEAATADLERLVFGKTRVVGSEELGQINSGPAKLGFVRNSVATIPIAIGGQGTLVVSPKGVPVVSAKDAETALKEEVPTTSEEEIETALKEDAPTVSEEDADTALKEEVPTASEEEIGTGSQTTVANLSQEKVIGLSEQDIHAVIVGNSMTGYSSRGWWTEYYAPDGTIRGQWRSAKDNYRYVGKWSVAGKLMCFDYGRHGKFCGTLEVRADRVLFYPEGGKARGKSSKLLPGNPKSL